MTHQTNTTTPTAKDTKMSDELDSTRTILKNQTYLPDWLEKDVLSTTVLDIGVGAFSLKGEGGGPSRINVNELVASPAAAPLITPTYDNTGQTVHPDVVRIPGGWNGFEYWMGITPYPFGNGATENPSILASHDGTNWVVPPGLVNPIAAPATGFWPDPDLTFDPVKRRLYCVWLGHRVSWSDDGITWTAPLSIVTGIGGSGEVSPAVIADAGAYKMWSVRKVDGVSNEILYRSADSLETVWPTDPPTVCTFTSPAGKEPWHIDVQKTGLQYIAAVACCDAETTGANTVLYLATSDDGLHWVFGDTPILVGRPGKWDATNIYRASLLPASGAGGVIADLWYSARSEATEWRTGRTEIRWNDPTLKTLSPLTTIARHEDAVQSRGTNRNLFPAPSLLRATGTRPYLSLNNLSGATSIGWDVPTESYTFALATTSSRNLTWDNIPVTEGVSYTLSYEGATSQNGRMFGAQIVWRDAAGVQLALLSKADGAHPAANKFERMQVSGIAPAGATKVSLLLITGSGDATPVAYKWRRVQFEVGSEATPWTPGPASVAVAAVGQTANLHEWRGPVTTAGQIVLGGVTKDGAVLLTKYTTANRPSAVTVGEGAVIYDDTLNLPIFSDGAVWKNFAGVAV